MAAKEAALNGLHEKLTEYFLQMLETPPEGGLKAAELAAISKFLKDNDITCIKDDPKLQRIREGFNENVLKFPFNPESAAGRA